MDNMEVYLIQRIFRNSNRDFKCIKKLSVGALAGLSDNAIRYLGEGGCQYLGNDSFHINYDMLATTTHISMTLESRVCMMASVDIFILKEKLKEFLL